jgi:nitroimidazol reductase NimA-like FMN-containing flavoprotein (pyridoxamine 5'-phosphate oxidase superfamily)
MQHEMRRKDREMDRAFAEKVIDKAAFATLATAGDDGTPFGAPYAVTLSMAREGEWLYFHCATEGRKIDNLRKNPKVCVTFVGDIGVPPGKFTINYESAVVFGVAEEVADSEEKIHGLRLICERYTPDNMADFDRAAAHSLAVTGIWKVRIDGISGKRKAPPA